MKNQIRTGKVSSINYSTGMVQVAYEDRETVTDSFPYLCLGEYNPPNIGSSVLVVYLSNGNGIVVGTYWNETNRPPETGKIYRKDISKEVGEAYIKYDNATKKLIIKAPIVEIEQGG